MSTSLPFFQVDAFASAPFTGNPAAVMPLDHWLDDATMQAIAAENNLSETAFTVPSTSHEVDYDLRWFTPTVEVDLCGHATLASAHILIKGDRVRFSTRSGVLAVTRGEDGLLNLDLPAYPVVEGEEEGLLDALGVTGPIFLSRGGNGAAIVLLSDEAAVRAVSPDFTKLRKIDRLVIVTAPGDDHAVASRVFAAYHGIDEDPVTGSAHAALTPFWADRLGRNRFTALQASARTGVIECEHQGERVVLGGRAVTVIEGYFQIA
ncbi:PhzF family phenazine biosynthesis protein [Sphingomonas sp. LY29]|uniref:PhzF family phenazine biosynthesis protein n=1 Tax=Sphingomonas sp. LY29 TaxID=3095341 RepID=UPI002D789063|nr:PhzF family phenazine biosynthesis protein [Sphingomonas sp. LY29]WRP26883.1 PhzF family phenazine biosynthesis protein [Sphingomonas sp. LY29]